MDESLSEEVRVELIEWDRFGESGHRWTLRFSTPSHDTTQPDIRDMEYRTNQKGDGLFSRNPDGDGSWNQTRGTGQWGLPADIMTAQKRVLHAWQATLGIEEK